MAQLQNQNKKLFLPNFMKEDPKNDILFKAYNCKILNENLISQFIDKCPICIQSFKKPVILTNCNHLFCKNCIKKWIDSNSICPICRKPNNKYITINSIINK